MSQNKEICDLSFLSDGNVEVTFADGTKQTIISKFQASVKWYQDSYNQPMAVMFGMILELHQEVASLKAQLEKFQNDKV